MAEGSPEQTFLGEIHARVSSLSYCSDHKVFGQIGLGKQSEGAV